MRTSARATALQDVFEDWLASRPARGTRAGNGALADTSAQLYRDMWAVFMQFMLSRPRRRGTDPSGLTGLRRADLQAFIETAQQSRASAWSDRYGWRMLHLIDRVMRFQLLRQGERPGPTSAAIDVLHEHAPLRHANARYLDHDARPLTEPEARRLQRHLMDALATSLQDTEGRDWKHIRDAAAAALMLGAGLAPGDLQALPLSALRLPPRPQERGWVDIPGDGLSPEHQAPLDDWAVPVVRRWLAVRQMRDIAGPWALPSTARGSALSRMSCHRRIVGVLTAAGVPGGVPFRLRHTCAVRWLRAGHSEDMVGQWLGLVERKALHRYVVLAQRPRVT